MTYSAEFIVNVGQYEHVKLTISGEEFLDEFANKGPDLHVLLGDYHASLKVAVLYGRDQALDALRSVGKVETLKDLAEVFKPGLPSDPEKLITEELDAKVLDVTEHAPQKPWERPVEAVPVKPWDVAAKQAEKPVQRGSSQSSSPQIAGLEDF